MMKLKDRNRAVPGGYHFYLPELKWSAPKNFPSFRVVCDALQAVIKANPFLAQKHKWPTDREGIEAWVDTYNATVCAKMGWDDYVLTGSQASFPKAQPPPSHLQNLAAAAARVKELMAGAKTLIEWDDSGDPPVERDLATSRAAVCASCPKNESGDWTQWFTVPAAELIKRRVEKVHGRGLSTIRDAQLHLCNACHCPLEVKVHIPIDWVVKRLTDRQKASLKQAPACWIVKEAGL